MQKQNLQESTKVNCSPSTHGEGEALTHIVGASPLCPKCPKCGFHVIQNQCGCGYEKVESKGFSRRAEYVGLGEELNLCGAKAVLLSCENYLHDYAKRLFCGREWCKRCGLDDSDMHKRRYARLMDKVFYLGSTGKNHGLGYFVFTIPSQIREKFKSKSRLARVGKAIRSLLKNHGFDVGLSRWHYFGDGEITEGELDLGVYHPHLNCLVVGRWIHEKELAEIREEWRRLLEDILGESVDVVDVNYQYFKSKAQWWHKGKYVTRATFKSLVGNEAIAEKLFSFRNLVFWGFGQGGERVEKFFKGRAVLGLYLDDVKGKEQEEVMTRKKFDELVSMSHMKCIKCMEQGDSVRIVTYQDFNGCRKVEDMEALKPRIERELSGGFYVLSPIILNKKPKYSGVDTLEQENKAYDDS